MYWYWWAWFVFVILLIFVPLGYGWGYRGWGPPYPRYYYRRGPGRVVPPPDGVPPAPYADDPGRRIMLDEPVQTARPGPWGILADLVWLAALGAAIWAIVAFAY